MANGLLENFLAKEKERALAQSSVSLQDYLQQANPGISSAVNQGLTPMQALPQVMAPQPQLPPIALNPASPGVERVDTNALYRSALESNPAIQDYIQKAQPSPPAQTRPTIPAQPQAPGTTLPSGAPRIGGLITRDSTGQTTAFQQGGGALGTVGTGAIPQASLSDFAARQQARDLDPLRRDNAQLAGTAPLTPLEQANVAAGRPSNVSAGQVEAAQRSEAATAAYAAAAPQRQALEEAQSAIESARFRRKEVTPDMLLNLQAAQQGLQTEPADQRTPDQVESQRLENERKRQIIEAGRQPQAPRHAAARADIEEAREQGVLTPEEYAEAVKQWKKKFFGIDPLDIEANQAEATQATEGGFNAQQESGIQRVMEANGISRAAAIKALKDAGKL